MGAAIFLRLSMVWRHWCRSEVDCWWRRQAGPKKLWNFEARACTGLQKNLDFINKNVRLVTRTPFQNLRYHFCCINVLKIHSCFIAILNASLTINLNGNIYVTEHKYACKNWSTDRDLSRHGFSFSKHVHASRHVFRLCRQVGLEYLHPAKKTSLEELVFRRIDLSQEIGVIAAMKKAPLVS